MLTTTRALVGRVLRPLLKAVEGQPRPGPYHLPLTGGWLPDGISTNWWQSGIRPTGGERSAIVERCIALYAETASSLPGAHWQRNARGGRTRVRNSALARILAKPNEYETPSSFMLNSVHSLYREGNCFALALRNDRFEIESVHLMDPRMSAPLVAEDGSIFFRLGGNDVISRMLGDDAPLIVPGRDVLHIKLHNSQRHPQPLVGETPLLAAMADIAVGNAFLQQQLQFLANQARPSAVLSTDLVLDKDQVQALRDRWLEQSKGLHAGGTPILTAGLKVQPWATPAKDAQLAELTKISSERICYAFGIPLQLLGLATTPATSTETLMQFWLATGLSFALNHVEQAFDRLFRLKGEPDDYCEFDTAALLRSAQKDRIEALARAVQGGIYSPNEARAAEDLDAVPYGDEPRLQAQVVPLSAAGTIPTTPAAAVSPSAPAVKSYHDEAVQLDFDALVARAKRPERMKAEPRAVIRKTTTRPVRVTKR